MLPAEFCDRYKNGLEEAGVTGVDERAIVGHAKSALGLQENDIVLGQNKVSSSVSLPPISFIHLSPRFFSLKRPFISLKTNSAPEMSRIKNASVSDRPRTLAILTRPTHTRMLRVKLPGLPGTATTR